MSVKDNKFKVGEEVFVDRGPYGLDKTTVDRVTKTQVILKNMPNFKFRHDGDLVGARGYASPVLRRSTPILERRHLENAAFNAATELASKVYLENFTDGELRDLIKLAHRAKIKRETLT